MLRCVEDPNAVTRQALQKQKQSFIGCTRGQTESAPNGGKNSDHERFKNKTLHGGRFQCGVSENQNLTLLWQRGDLGNWEKHS